MKIILLSIFFIFNIARGYDTKGILENLGKEKEIKEGDPFFARLTLWPYEAQDEKSFYELEGKPLLDFFLVTRVSKVKRSENNNQAVEIDLHLVLKDYFISREFYIFNHRDINIPVELKGITPQRRALKTKDFFIRDELPVGKDSSWGLYLVLASVSVVLALFLILRKRKKIKIIKEKYIAGTIEGRESLEEFYCQRKKVIDSYPGKKVEIENLLKKIDMIQYRPTWSEEELRSLQTEYEKVFFGSEENGDSLS